MRAIILAAGVGSRMGELTKEKPKCLLEIDNTTIIKKQVISLNECGITDISVVLGYKEEMVKEATRELGLNYYINPRFKETGLLESFFAAKEKLDGEVILVCGDVFFEPSVIKKLLVDKNDICIVSDNSKEIDHQEQNSFENYYGKITQKGSTKVSVINGKVIKISKNMPLAETSAEYIGIIKFSARGIQIVYQKIKSLIEAGEIIDFSSPSYLLRWFINSGQEVYTVFVNYSEYAEIDYEKDLIEARERLKKSIKGVIFDAGDVLHYRDNVVWKTMAEFFAQYGHTIAPEEFKEAYEKYRLNLFKGELTKDGHLKKALQDLALPLDDDFFRKFAEKFRSVHSNIKMTEGALELFEKLKEKGIKIAILTDTLASEQNRREWFKEVGSNQFIDVIVCSSESGFTKDEKGSYETALQKMGLNNEEVLFVGHQKYEMDGAKKAQVKSLSLAKGVGENYFIHDLNEVLKFV